jgi:hypothetical protein
VVKDEKRHSYKAREEDTMKVSEPDQDNRPLELAQRTMSAPTTKEFGSAVSKAIVSLDKQEWNYYLAECRRLREEGSKPKENTL